MNDTHSRNAVVFVIDGIGANMLACYGNTMFQTENFNRLAARSMLFDHAITPSSDLQAAYNAFATAVDQDGNAHTLIPQLAKKSITSVLLTDQPQLKQNQFADAFDRVVDFDTPPTTSSAKSIEETQLASFFAQATDSLNELQPNSLSWFHCRGLTGPWDAPYDLRRQLADPDDPEPPTFCQPPSETFDPQVDDPDRLLGYQQSCAAQLAMLDDFLGVLLDQMDTDLAWQSTLFCLVANRGYPMGEHQVVGNLWSEQNNDASYLAACHSESIHVPLMVCFPQQTELARFQTVRSGQLTQANIVSNWLLDWFSEPSQLTQRLQMASSPLPDPKHQVAMSSAGNVQTIQTPAWKLIRSKDHHRLYVKPDDRWEVNDVSRRCPEIATDLAAILDKKRDAEASKQTYQIELPEHLAHRQD